MRTLITLLSIIMCFSCQKDDETYTPVIPNADLRTLAGGGTTIAKLGAFSFDNPAPNLNATNLEIHLQGDADFEQAFVTTPAPVNPGLGAQFNNTSCIACHPKDGRSAFPENLNTFTGFFLRISIPGTGSNGEPNPAPGFGDQLAQNAIFGKTPEVQFEVSYQDLPVTFSDGTVVTLKKPIYSIADPYIPIPSNALFSPRIAPPIYGLGLLEAITESDIVAQQDVNDSDNDGISGKANYVWNPETEATALGRFGWKANAPTLMTQSAGAYNNDIGITSPLFPRESSHGQTNGHTLSEDNPEISQETLDAVALYCRTLAVPAARNLDDPQVARGFELFEEARCTACHTPRYTTGEFPGIPAISKQTIYPYTDMLLHDMGAELADGRPDFLADGNEWQTRPLWGIGLTKAVNGHTDFLHDGRAKNVEEAILWHGGEAEKSKQFYTTLNKKDRESLLAFVNAI